MIRSYRRHFLKVDVVLCFLAAAALMLELEHESGPGVVHNILSMNRTALYGAFASVFGSLLGFSMAAIAIVLQSTQSPRMRTIRQSRFYPQLWETYRSSIRWLAAATAASLLALTIDRESSHSHLCTSIVAFAGMVAAERLGWSIWLLDQIVALTVSSSSGELRE